MGNFGNHHKRLQKHLGKTIARKYQLKELFSENNNISNTSKYRNHLWTIRDQRKGDVKYCCPKERIKELKEILSQKIKALTKEEEWPKVLKKLEKDKFPEYYFDKYGINMKWCNFCNEYRTQVVRYKKAHPFLTQSEWKEAIKSCSYNYTNRKRLINKMEMFWKEKRSKLQRIDWLVDKNDLFIPIKFNSF
jgi:hypothetical protein